METYRYQELVYLVVPISLGMEFFMAGRRERAMDGSRPLGAYILDLCGFLFTALVPAMFVFTIVCIETNAFPLRMDTLARFDRYGVMFLFLGAWWQVYIWAALRARRFPPEQYLKKLWLPFLGAGIYISLLILWVSPWGLKWASMVWFFALTALMVLFKAGPRAVEKTMWVLAGLTFVIENIFFVWLETLV